MIHAAIATNPELAEALFLVAAIVAAVAAGLLLRSIPQALLAAAVSLVAFAALAL